MKIQDLAIIFVIIIIPISLVLSIYTQFQMQTINMQTLYDTKLTSATYDAIKAFQLNSANSTTSDLTNSKIRDLEASVTTFRNSLKSAFELNGYTEEELNNYIPALVYTLYDGFYIYSPYENINHRYETEKDEQGKDVKNPYTDEPVYVKDSSGNEIPIDENGETLYGLKPYINYSCRYIKNDIDVVMTYALDNYITVQGKIGDEYVNKSGYLIEGIEVKSDGSVTYNGVTIEKEHLKENIGEDLYSYAKINGTKYYLMEDIDVNEDGNIEEGEGQIVYFLNGIPTVQYKTGNPRYIALKKFIQNNDSAQQYYKDAYEFTKWFETTGLYILQYKDAYDQVIDNEGKVNIERVFDENDERFIFEELKEGNTKNIENETSNFNEHRLAIIRHKIEVNLAIAIANYNNYSGATNEFQMPELKEDEWDYITHNISLMSFLQGLPIGGKTYNGYTLVTNSESKEVVMEQDIYILGSDGNYHKIGDKGLEGDNSIDDRNYGVCDDNPERSAGRLNLDFKRTSITDNAGVTKYYYPLKAYNASYDSIVMQNKVTTYDDIYEYVKSYDVLKQTFYTALARERYGMYRLTNETERAVNVLVVGIFQATGDWYDAQNTNLVDMLNGMDGVKATNIDDLEGANINQKLEKAKNNYDLIILNASVWDSKLGNTFLSSLAKETNIITIGNDENTDTMGTLISDDYDKNQKNMKIKSQITDDVKDILGNITIKETFADWQYRVEFDENVEILCNGKYFDEYGGYVGESPIIGCLKSNINGEQHRWIHSQMSLDMTKLEDKQLLKALVKYALNIN